MRSNYEGMALKREPRRIDRDSADYPTRLREAPRPPAFLYVDGDLEGGPVVAIVGARACSVEAAIYAEALAGAVVTSGGIVISGGAVGIDAAAHRGAMKAGGRTWVVSPSGPSQVYPAENAPLFDEVVANGGTMIWPYEQLTPGTFHGRNEVLAALCDAFVIVQARLGSGAQNAASYARAFRRPIWACAAPPWMTGCEGCAVEIDRGARPLLSSKQLLESLGVPPPPIPPDALPPSRKRRPRATSGALFPPRPRAPVRDLFGDELAIYEALSEAPQHMDEIASRADLSTGSAVTALLTLALEDVVVEGPGGFFRRNPR